MKKCKKCGADFLVTERDKQLLERVSPTFAGKKFLVPEPTLCPTCRMQRRMVWRGELNLFKRKSSFSGKDIISFYPPEIPHRVYNKDEWWSDDWSPLDYGRDFDFNRPFFPQFKELLLEVPLLALSTVHNEENCDYTNCASWNKNCYLISGANHNEDCLYGNYINYSKSSLDNNFVRKCELCYECVDCTTCYNVRYSQNSHNCSDSFFLYNCRNCKNCVGSANLVGKEYYFQNEQLTKVEYQNKVAALRLDTRSGVEKAKAAFEAHRLKFPHKYFIGEMNENSTGNGIINCRNTFDCFDVSELEDCSYCGWFHKAKDCMDVYAWGFPAELCYECMEAGDNSYQALFTVSSYGSQNVIFCYYTMHSRNCFGCVGLKRNEYCIFNKQYSKTDYEQLVAKILTHLQQTGEWGEFFPISTSPLPYNVAITQDYFPLSKEEALKLGTTWHEFQNEFQKPQTPVAIPDSISDVDESICDKVLTCSVSGKPYKLTKQEFKFYQDNSIPLPDKAFNVRHQNRLKRRNPRRLWDRKCAKCSTALHTSYAPERPEIIYCEKCYLESVY